MKLAVIPARGGSKRIPRKNIKLFCGKPIIEYSISAAVNSQLFDYVIVSTDDKNIAEVSIQAGAEVPFFRPVELADDFTGTNDVVKHAIKWFTREGVKIDYACCIYATAPFLRSQYIIKGYEALINSNHSYAFTVTSFPFPIQRALFINKNKEVEPYQPEHIFTRSQDLREYYHDAGQFYWGTAQAFLEDVLTFSTNSLPIILPRYLVQDIDTEEDWIRAELMYKAMQLGSIEAGK